jgi:hypothetical protein
MIESTLVDGVRVAAFDNLITNILSSYKLEDSGNAMLVAIENEDGAVYRVIQSEGMGPYMHVCGELQCIGMLDKYAPDLDDIASLLIPKPDGYDSKFYPPSELTLQRPPKLETPFSEVEAAEEELDDIPETTRSQIIKARVGQGDFRRSLVEYWKGCAVTGASFAPVLRASHIKPWASSSNNERLDVFNGLLLSPNLDSAFDQGYISFEETGLIIISKELSKPDAYEFRITSKLSINRKFLREEHFPFLEFHRSSVFRG